jgi:hypothetical protein
MFNAAGGYSPHRLGEGCYHPQLCRKLTRELFVLSLKLENVTTEGSTSAN